MKVVVAGGGISGLSIAFRLKQGRAGLDITVLEAADRLGGTIHTGEHDGFRYELGPNGFLDSKPHTLSLVEDLGLTDRLLCADDASARRFVVVGGELVQLPTSPPAFLTSRLLSLGSRWRVVREQWVKKRTRSEPETVADFARRRLGPQAYERLIDPFVSGIFAGDPERLAVGAAFPRLVELEAEYGSLIKASRKLAKSRPKGSNAAGPGGKLTSFPGGMSELIDALEGALGDAIRRGAAISAVEKTSAGWSVTTGGERIDGVDQLVLALPAPVAASLLAPVDRALAAPLESIPYAPVAVVALGYERSAVAHPLDGFGFLIPGGEGRPILGCLWASSIFPDRRAPPGCVLLRTLVGGRRNEALPGLSEPELIELVKAELEPLLGPFGAEPVFTNVVRHERAIPQYEVGHLARVAALEQALARWPGLTLAGNAYRGVGVNDCTRDSERIASDLLSSP